jgi:hypothetical protein
MQFEDCSQEAIETKVREVFQRMYGANVEYVNVCYKIGDFYELTAKLTKL